MSPGLILFVGGIYAVIAIEQFTKGNIPMAVIFSGYAFSNLGFFAASS